MEEILTGMTMGLDLGDRYSYYVMIDARGEIEEEGRVATRRAALKKLLGERPACRVVMEAGTHSGWVSDWVSVLGHEALVANPRQLPLIYGNVKKADRCDAHTLARLGRFDPRLLKPIRHRDMQRQQDLVKLRCRENLIKSRTQLINAVRGHLKQFGMVAGSCSAAAFSRRVRPQIPPELEESLGPLLSMIEQLTLQIRAMDKTIEGLCQQKYPQTGVLRQIPGVGPITALAFVLTLESPHYFATNRDAGPYLGLVPRRDQSGQRDRQLGITKAGNGMLRRLLVNCAQYILGPFGIDSDLRRHGERIAARGGTNARKRAVVAVARKLAVVMLCLWRTGQVYEPLYNDTAVAA